MRLKFYGGFLVVAAMMLPATAVYSALATGAVGHRARQSNVVVTTVIPAEAATILRQPAMISQVVPLGNNRFVFAARGKAGDDVIVESSTDLLNWIYYDSFAATNSDPVYFGPWEADGAARFFRTRLGP